MTLTALVDLLRTGITLRSEEKLETQDMEAEAAALRPLRKAASG
jgi:hypothetical protein